MIKAKFVLILTIIILFLAGMFLFGSQEYRYTEEYQRTAVLGPGGAFALANVNGDVRVSSWKENRVEVRAVKSARRSEKDLKDIYIVFDASADRVSVRAVWPKFRVNFQAKVDFEVKVPEGVRLAELKTVNGGVMVTGVYSAVEAETTNGRLEGRDIKGDVTFETTNGGVKIAGAEGEVRAETTNGGIEIAGLVFSKRVRAETTNGSIVLSLNNPEQVNANLLAETTNGSISVDFPVTLQNLTRSRRKVEARLGSGGAEIRLRTVNGSIRITR